MMREKPTIVIVVIVLLVSLGIGYTQSTLVINDVTSTFSATRSDGLKTLTVKAPFGYRVIDFSVVPSNNPKHPFSIGGKGTSQNPTGLFDDYVVHKNYIPGNGSTTFQVESYTLISPQLNFAATAKLPKDKAILEKCGSYVVVTKNENLYNDLDSIVQGWTLEKGPWKD